MPSQPTLVMIPCFSGAPWQLHQLTHLKDWPKRTMRLPDGLDDLEKLADFVLDQINDLDCYVLLGDSFGAVISIAVAPLFPGIFYRQFTLRIHAATLKSQFDAEGEIPWSEAKTREFFLQETPHAAYVNRLRAVNKADYINQLPKINVPTLILTPEEDRVVGKEAAGIMLRGIKGSREVVLPRTGHMFRCSHPWLYSSHIKTFLAELPQDHC